jgi:hypothetical protein
MEELKIPIPIPSPEVISFEKILLIAAVCCPAALSYAISNAIFPRAPRDKASIESMASMAISIAVIVLIASIIAPENLVFFNSPGFLFYPIAVVLGPICILFEYFINFLYIYILKRQIPTFFYVQSQWTESNGTLHLVLIFFIVAGEELIFRQMMFSVFMETFNLSFIGILLITSFFYASNHIFMGFNSMGTKFFTGMMYGSLYYFSGLSIIIPVTTHFIQNVILLRYPQIPRSMISYIYTKTGLNYAG